jgi:hypothetical protein
MLRHAPSRSVTTAAPSHPVTRHPQSSRGSCSVTPHSCSSLQPRKHAPCTPPRAAAVTRRRRAPVRSISAPTRTLNAPPPALPRSRAPLHRLGIAPPAPPSPRRTWSGARAKRWSRSVRHPRPRDGMHRRRGPRRTPTAALPQPHSHSHTPTARSHSTRHTTRYAPPPSR